MELCLFYKGETENLFADMRTNNYRHYWNLESVFFSNPKVFSDPNVTELYKAPMITALNGYLAKSCKLLNKAIKDYFANRKELQECLRIEK